MQKTQVRSLGGEDPLEKKNGNPLHYSCLENSMDRGVQWATVLGMAESDTTVHLNNIQDVSHIQHAIKIIKY